MQDFVPFMLHLQLEMEQKIFFKYINTYLGIGMVDIKNVYLLSPKFQKLLPEV